MEYGFKSYHFKTTIVNCTKVCIKGLKFNRSHRKMLVCPTSMWRNKQTEIRINHVSGFKFE